PVRLVAGASRNQNAPGPDEAAQRDRNVACAVPARTPESSPRLLPGVAIASAARAGRAADAWLRRHARVRPWIARVGETRIELGGTDGARGEPRRGRDLNLASGDDDARLGAA